MNDDPGVRTSNTENIKPPYDVALPKITAEIWESYQDEEFIEDSPRWAWTQAAVDFACEIVRPAVQAEIEHLTRERDELTVRLAELARGWSEAVDWKTERDRLRAALEWYARAGWMEFANEDDNGRRAREVLSGAGHAVETTAKPTDSELYSSSELFRHIWVCPMGWIGDKLIYGPGYTSADMKPWLVKLRRLVGFEHPEGTPLEQPEKADGSP